MADKSNPGQILTSTFKGDFESIPQPFRNVCKFTLTTQPVPLNEELSAPTDALIESKLTQTRINERVESLTSIVYPDTPFTGTILTKDGQLATVTYTIGPTGDLVITPSALTVDASITPISDLVSVSTVTETATLFPNDSFSVSIAKNIPSEFLEAIKTVETSIVVAGTATFPTLLPGEISKTEQQLTVFTKRITVVAFADLDALPLTLTGSERSSEHGGALLTVKKTLSTEIRTQSQTDLKVVEFSSAPIGSGYFITIEKYNPSASWPIITEYERDPLYGSLITITTQMVDAATYVPPSGQSLNGSLIGSGAHPGILETYRPIDQWRGIKTVLTYALPEAYVETSEMGHRYPQRVKNIFFCTLTDTVTGITTVTSTYVPGVAAKERVVNTVVNTSFLYERDDILPIAGIYSNSDAADFVSEISETSINILSLDLKEVITDEYPLTWCGTERFVPASVPNNTEWEELIGSNFIMISATCVPWKAGLWKRQVVTIPLL